MAVPSTVLRPGSQVDLDVLVLRLARDLGVASVEVVTEQGHQPRATSPS